MDLPSNAQSLLFVLCIAVAAPLIAEFVPRIRLPVVVLEILLGIIAGPHALDWAHKTPMIDGLAHYGLAFLFFLAGFEIDLRKIRGRPIALGLAGWLLSLGIGLAMGFALNHEGVVLSGILVGVALTTTALGTLIPVVWAKQKLGNCPGPRFSFVLTA